MKTILITGVAGLLGNNFLRFLLEKNYRVIGIDNLFGGYEEFLPQHSNFEFYKFDLSDHLKLSKIFENNRKD